MIFKSLRLENFASFYGRHSFDLSANGDRHVVVFVGGTGYGKTSLFDAMNWGLYGDHYAKEMDKNRKRPITDFVNQTAVSDALASSAVAEMSVEISFEHDGVSYRLRRAIRIPSDQLSKGLGKAVHQSFLEFQETMPDGNTRKVQHVDVLLDEILPSNVRDYFLFDGDRIHNLSRPGASVQVRDAIYRVVDLEVLSLALQKFQDAEAHYRSESRKYVSADAQSLEDAYSKCKEDRDDKRSELDLVKNEIRLANAERNDAVSMLESLPATREPQQRVSKLKSDYTACVERKKTALINLKKCANGAVFTMAKELLQQLHSELDKQRQVGELPRNVSITLLKDVLGSGECICGTPLNDGSSSRATLESRLLSEQRRKETQSLLGIFYSCNECLSRIGQVKENLEQDYSSYCTAEDNLRRIGLDLEQAQRDLDATAADKAEELHSVIRKCNDDCEVLVRKEERIATAIEKLDAKIYELDGSRKKYAKNNEKVRALRFREGLSISCKKILGDLYTQFAEESRAQVEALTIEEFGKFVFSSSAYTVRLGANFELQVLNSLGQPALQRLSMGQSQCLSLAFITAISRVSGKHPPLVIDMPLGRLDATVHGIVSQRLPELTKQLILFLIPGAEWYESTRAILEPQCARVFNLFFDADLSQTSSEVCDVF